MSGQDEEPTLGDERVREAIRKTADMNVVLSVTRVPEELYVILTKLGPPPAPEPDDNPER